FLLSRPFLEQAAGGRRVDVRSYAQRRMWRILPLYWTFVVVGTVVLARQWSDLTRGLPYLLFLNPIAAPLSPFSDVWWSLMTEAQFYVMLPIVALLLMPPAGPIVSGLLPMLYIMAYIAWMLQIVGIPDLTAQIWVGLSLFALAPVFICGALAASFYRDRGPALRDRLAASRLLRAGGGDALLVLLLLALALLLRWTCSISYEVAQSAPFAVWHVAAGALWAGVVLAMLLLPLHLKPLLHNRVLMRLGVLSYSIYLVHVPVVKFAVIYLRGRGVSWLGEWNARSAALAAGLVMLSIGISMVTYRWIELPFLARKARVRG
ncbi:MAG: acyltransferase family protein, partial [Candidatus Binatia bacterium]